MRINTLPFSPHYDFIARKPLTISGREYRRGDMIDRAIVPERILRAMYEQKLITPKAPAPSVLARRVDRDTVHVSPAKDGLRAKHIGFGRYKVLHGEDVIEASLPAADAKAKYPHLFINANS